MLTDDREAVIMILRKWPAAKHYIILSQDCLPSIAAHFAQIVSSKSMPLALQMTILPS